MIRIMNSDVLIKERQDNFRIAIQSFKGAQTYIEVENGTLQNKINTSPIPFLLLGHFLRLIGVTFKPLYVTKH